MEAHDTDWWNKNARLVNSIFSSWGWQLSQQRCFLVKILSSLFFLQVQRGHGGYQGIWILIHYTEGVPRAMKRQKSCCVKSSRTGNMQAGDPKYRLSGSAVSVFFSALYLWLVVGFESCSAPQQTQHSKSRSGSQPRWSFFVLPKHILAPKRQAQTLENILTDNLSRQSTSGIDDHTWDWRPMGGHKDLIWDLHPRIDFVIRAQQRIKFKRRCLDKKSMSTTSKSSLYPSRQVKYLKPLSLTLTREGKPVAWTQCRAVYTTARKRWCLSVSLTTV